MAVAHKKNTKTSAAKSAGKTVTNKKSEPKTNATQPTPAGLTDAFKKLPAQLAAILPAGLDTKTINRFWQHAMDEDMVSASITQTWTDQALKCYLTCSDCQNCSIPTGQYSFDCQMNKVVPSLLATIGGPDVDKVEKLIPVLDRY